nr:PAS domain S-box protein [Steroidobacteraceae bacterium]
MHEERQPTAARDATPGTAPRGSNEAELEFRSLLDAAVDAIIVIDHRGRIEQFSLSAERIFGYTAAEVIGQKVEVLMPEPYRSDHDAYMRRYEQTGAARIIGVGREVKARRKDGTVFPCELAVGKVQGVEPPRFIGFIHDITPRKLTDERLRRSESELRLAQELANLGNYVVHLDQSEPDYYSPQLCRILGIGAAEVAQPLTAVFERWVHPGDREKFEQARRELQAPTNAFDCEY